VVGATGFEPVTSSVSGKNQLARRGWLRPFLQMNSGIGVSETDRSCPLLSGGPCPRRAPRRGERVYRCWAAHRMYRSSIEPHEELVRKGERWPAFRTGWERLVRWEPSQPASSYLWAQYWISCFGVTVGLGSGRRSASARGRGPRRRSSGLRRSYLRATRRAQASGRGAGSRRDGGRRAQEASASTPKITADTPSLAPSRDAMWRAAAPP
jgi:hypothetical protein